MPPAKVPSEILHVAEPVSAQRGASDPRSRTVTTIKQDLVALRARNAVELAANSVEWNVQSAGNVTIHEFLLRADVDDRRRRVLLDLLQQRRRGDLHSIAPHWLRAGRNRDKPGGHSEKRHDHGEHVERDGIRPGLLDP